MPITAGQILVNEILPPKYRNYERVLGAKELEGLLASISKDDPEYYKDVSARLMRLGNRAAYESGSTLRLSDIAPTFDRSIVLKRTEAAEQGIRSNPRLTDEQKHELISELYDKTNDIIKQQTYETATAAGNPFAMQVKSKARGNQDQLAAMISTPGIYQDSRGKTVPMFIQHSFAEGLTPAEYWAGSFGARLGIFSTKYGTRQGGYLGKLLSSASIDQVVTENDCGGAYGMPVNADDPDNIGCVLQQDVAGHEAGEIITKDVLSDIAKSGTSEIIVRSPTTCACKDGVCSKCCGIRELGKFPDIGYNLGVNAASALSERIAQGALNCLAEGTLVRMADGSSREIELVNPGDMVLGSDLNGNVRPVKVVARYDQGMQPCLRTRLIENGTRRSNNPGIYIDCTSIHKILGTRVVTGQKEQTLNWKPRMLEIGTKSREFYAYTVRSFDDSNLVDEPLALVIGALIGDGCYTESVSGIHISSADETEIDDLNKSISNFGLRFNRLEYHDGIYYRLSGIDHSSRKNAVKEFLKKHNMYGKFAHEKEIPEVVHTWKNHSVGCLLGGLIATDGLVYKSDKKGKPGISFASCNRKLVVQFKELIGLRFGVLGSAITKTGRAGDGNRKHSQWQFSITKPAEIKIVMDNITIPGVKNDMLKKLVSEYTPGKNYYRIAYKRVSQENIGIRHTYDLEVDHPDHIYLLANGIICHNTKHSGKKAKGKSSYSGFNAIKNMTTVPKDYTDAAVLSPIDGKVTKIEAAPQGGTYIHAGEQKQYVAPGYDILVKEGDDIEAGDQISDGVINPAEVVRYKGIGEGRRYFTNRFTQMMRDSNYGVSRRNVEAVARALINHVEIEDEDSEAQMLPGDVVTYSRWSYGYKPRQDSRMSGVSQAVGQYLEQPVLHYTIGTKISRKTAEDMKKYGVTDILVNRNPIGVTPVMQSVVETTGSTDDWMARLGTTYLKTRLTEDVQHGAVSDVHGVNPIPGIAKGTEFGNYFEPGVHRDGGYTY